MARAFDADRGASGLDARLVQAVGDLVEVLEEEILVRHRVTQLCDLVRPVPGVLDVLLHLVEDPVDLLLHEVSLHFNGDGPLAGDPVSDDYVNVPLLGEEDEFQWWRFRIHARGRDTAHDPSTPPEQHLIQIWPAPRAPEIRHKLTDQTGHRRRNPDPDYYARGKAAEAAAGNLPEGAAYTSQRVTPLVASLEEEDQRP